MIFKSTKLPKCGLKKGGIRSWCCPKTAGLLGLSTTKNNMKNTTQDDDKDKAHMSPTRLFMGPSLSLSLSTTMPCPTYKVSLFSHSHTKDRKTFLLFKRERIVCYNLRSFRGAACGIKLLPTV